jgi:hypothetical protein
LKDGLFQIQAKDWGIWLAYEPVWAMEREKLLLRTSTRNARIYQRNRSKAFGSDIAEGFYPLRSVLNPKTQRNFL